MQKLGDCQGFALERRSTYGGPSSRANAKPFRTSADFNYGGKPPQMPKGSPHVLAYLLRKSLCAHRWKNGFPCDIKARWPLTCK